MTNKYFPAANTPKGFVNFFREALDEAECDVIYLKGGPGTGKSTFMKKIGGEAAKRGYAVEQLFCSSDADSLDILRLPALKTVIADATAPHNFDPCYPGVRGNILNLADFLDEKKLKARADEIIALSDRKSAAFKLLYNYLRASGDASGSINAIASSAMDEKIIAAAADEIYESFLDKQQPLPARKAFADALTGEGTINAFSDCAGKIVSVNCRFKVGSRSLMRVAEKRLLRLTTQKYYDIASPDDLAHISVGNVDLLSDFQGIADYSYNLDDAFSKDRIALFSDDLENLEAMRDKLVSLAREQLSKAKAYHRQIENYYVAAMDFDAVGEAFEKVRQRIFG